MQRSLISTYALLLLANFAVAVGSNDLPDPRDRSLAPSQRLEALLDRMRLEHERLGTLEADFVQLKESAMLLQPSQAHGVFSYEAPDKIRWEYLDPNPISLLIAAMFRPRARAA